MRNFESKLNPLLIAISVLAEVDSDDFLHTNKGTVLCLTIPYRHYKLSLYFVNLWSLTPDLL